MTLKNLVESQQLDAETIFDLFDSAEKLRKSEEKPLTGKILATLFYEPSTRTRFSFESAMLKLGGSVINTENAGEFSSAAKGESLEDTIRVVSNYADCIVLRHKEEGSSKKAAGVSKVPIINAGDGAGQHPTQALLDLYTIWKEIGKIENIKIAIIGDLKYGRAVRSLCYLLGKFKGVEIIFVSPKNLKMGEDIKNYLNRHNILFKEKENLNEILSEVDIVYVTRIQKERMSQTEYEKARGQYKIDLNNLNLIKKTARLLHPLPHIKEIDLPIEIEQFDERIAYFRQAENGLYIRMALLCLLMKENPKDEKIH